jgi:preprotein translocase subunit SecG
MEILRYILIVVEVFCCICLIGLVLIQKSKSEGLGMAFGSGMGENLFGSRAGNVLTKMTIVFGVVFMVNTVILAMVYSGVQERSLMATQGGAAPVAQPVEATPGAVVETGAAQPGGVPTLPGADLGDTGTVPQDPAAVPVDAVPAPVEPAAPAPAAEEVPAATP